MKNLLIFIHHFPFKLRLFCERIKLSLKPNVGNPALNASCCGQRPSKYGENSTVNSVEDLSGLLNYKGAYLSGWIKYYQCSNCGQNWVEDWHQEKFGGYYELMKIEK